MPGMIHTHFAKGATGAALTFTPAADSEIQNYFDVNEAYILTAQGNVSTLTLAVFGELSITQEASYANDEWKITVQNDAIVATGDPPEQHHCAIGKRVIPDMDLTSTPGGPGSDTSGLAVHVLYGDALYLDTIAGKDISYKVTGTGDDSTSFTAFAGGTISDLDPEKFYAIYGLTPILEDQAGVGIHLDSPSLQGLNPGMLYANGGVPSYWKDPAGRRLVAGIVSGRETITLYSCSHVAQTPDCLVHMREIGNIDASPRGGSRIAPTGTGGIGLVDVVKNRIFG
jgi:hypothetical protein